MRADRVEPERRATPSRPNPSQNGERAAAAPTLDYLGSNMSAMQALQRTAGNYTTGSLLTNLLTVQRDRAELEKAYQEELSGGKWAEAAVRLNGFSDADINRRLKALTYEQRKSLLAGCPDWNHRVRTPALELNYKEALTGNRLEDAAVILNAFSESDILGHFAKLPLEKHFALLMACPEPAKRVLEVGMRLQAGQSTRVWPVADFIALWEKLHGRKMTDDEKKALARGCIGITVLNLGDGNVNPPLGLSFDSFARAVAVSQALNEVLKTATTVQKYGEAVGQHPLLSQLTGVLSALPSGNTAEWKAVVFSKRFFSNQNADDVKRRKPDKKAFLPDAKTGQVDMTGYGYLGRPDSSKGYREDMINFDYGWYDETTNTWWHANHKEPDMKVYQSTLAHYSRPLQNFDRQVFSVAMAKKP